VRGARLSALPRGRLHGRAESVGLLGTAARTNALAGATLEQLCPANPLQPAGAVPSLGTLTREKCSGFAALRGASAAPVNTLEAVPKAGLAMVGSAFTAATASSALQGAGGATTQCGSSVRDTAGTSAADGQRVVASRAGHPPRAFPPLAVPATRAAQPPPSVVDSVSAGPLNGGGIGRTVGRAAGSFRARTRPGAPAAGTAAFAPPHAPLPVPAAPPPPSIVPRAAGGSAAGRLHHGHLTGHGPQPLRALSAGDRGASEELGKRAGVPPPLSLCSNFSSRAEGSRGGEAGHTAGAPSHASTVRRGRAAVGGSLPTSHSPPGRALAVGNACGRAVGGCVVGRLARELAGLGRLSVSVPSANDKSNAADSDGVGTGEGGNDEGDEDSGGDGEFSFDTMRARLFGQDIAEETCGSSLLGGSRLTEEDGTEGAPGLTPGGAEMSQPINSEFHFAEAAAAAQCNRESTRPSPRSKGARDTDRPSERPSDLWQATFGPDAYPPALIDSASAAATRAMDAHGTLCEDSIKCRSARQLDSPPAGNTRPDEPSEASRPPVRDGGSDCSSPHDTGTSASDVPEDVRNIRRRQRRLAPCGRDLCDGGGNVTFTTDHDCREARRSGAVVEMYEPPAPREDCDVLPATDALPSGRARDSVELLLRRAQATLEASRHQSAES